MATIYTWNFSAVWPYRELLLRGLAGTVEIALAAIIVGVVLGGLLAWMRMSKLRRFRIPAAAFICFYRNTPAIVHFFWIYYALPVLAQISLSAFVAAVLALSTQSSAFYAEVFRGGITSIERGQWEGAKALGMTSGRALWRVILPQVVRRMLPPFMERTFELVKSTALASSLAYAELLYQAMQINSKTFRPLEVYTVIAVLYFLLLFVCSQGSYLLERRLSHVNR